MSGYRAKKRLGQNFLKSSEVIAGIVAQLDLDENSTVIEIGSGRGSLTLPLAESGARVIAVEFDQDLIGYLGKLMRKFKNVEVVRADFLTYQPAIENYRVVGNIPYNISSPVIDWLVAHRGSVEMAALMVQKEVASRLAASPGSKDWSPLAIFTQLEFDVRIAFEVPPDSFSPPPEVTSAVVVLTPRPRIETGNRQHFETIVRAAFKQRRKQLVNNLSAEFENSSEQVLRALESVGVAPTARAEQLTIEQFIKLTALVYKT